MTSDSFKIKDDNFHDLLQLQIKGTIFITSDSFKIKEDSFHDLWRIQNKGG